MSQEKKEKRNRERKKCIKNYINTIFFSFRSTNFTTDKRPGQARFFQTNEYQPIGKLFVYGVNIQRIIYEWISHRCI